MNDDNKAKLFQPPIDDTEWWDEFIRFTSLSEAEQIKEEREKRGDEDEYVYEEEDLDVYYDIYNQKFRHYIESDRHKNDSLSDDIGDLLASGHTSIEDLASDYEYDRWLKERTKYIRDKKALEPPTQGQLKSMEISTEDSDIPF
jgi:hypothetical protein